MIDGIALTLSLLSFSGFIWVYFKNEKSQRRVNSLRKQVLTSESLIQTFRKDLEAVATFDSRLIELQKLTEQHGSKITQIQMGKR